MKNFNISTMEKVLKFLNGQKAPVSIWHIHRSTGWRWLSIKAALDWLFKEKKIKKINTNNTTYYWVEK